MMQDMKQALPI